MNKINTDYGLRIPTEAEIRQAFGSLSRAVEVTGGDVPTLLFYLHNTDRVAAAPPVGARSDEFAKGLREAALTEQVTAAFEALDKPTIKAVAQQVGVCRAVARRMLVSSGKWPREVRDARPA